MAAEAMAAAMAAVARAAGKENQAVEMEVVVTVVELAEVTAAGEKAAVARAGVNT